LWNIILKEREEGFEHRKPKKRIKRTTKIVISTPPLLPQPTPNNMTLQIDTQSLNTMLSSI